MKPMRAEKIIEKIEELGLKLTSKTGGSFIPDGYFTESKIKRTKKFLKYYDIIDKDDNTIHILDPSLFLRSVTETEENLDVKLFS